ncbi:MAG TPA: hypothetical protein PK859_08755 [Spirochaetota bacterium]|nr:hypothetical protein [Spirochaetota bacterium]HPR49668.1 hypothetical protein [Spirochaetota bacterium]
MNKEMVYGLAVTLADQMYNSLAGNERRSWVINSPEFSILIIGDRPNNCVELVLYDGDCLADRSSISMLKGEAQ